MKAIINETQFWYYDICDKTIIIRNKSKQNNSQSQKQKKEYGTVVEEYEYCTPEIGEVIYILNDTIEDCRKKYFHSFEYRCIYDIKFTNMENIEEVDTRSSLGYMKINFLF